MSFGRTEQSDHKNPPCYDNDYAVKSNYISRIFNNVNYFESELLRQEDHYEFNLNDCGSQNCPTLPNILANQSSISLAS